MQYFGHATVRLAVQIGVFAPGLHTLGQMPLHRVHCVHQFAEQPRIRPGPGARDVGGVAVDIGAGVDQKASMRFRGRAIAIVVMQNRGVFVQAHDTGVRQQIGIVAGGIQIGEVDAQFRCAGFERRRGRLVAGHRDSVGRGDAGDFPVGLDRARLVQARQQRRRIEICVAAQRAEIPRVANQRGGHGFVKLRLPL